MDESAAPLVSVVIPSWNRRDDLAMTLESVYEQDYPAMEVIVIDNGSGDETRQFLENYERPVRLILNNRNLGASQARNQGILASHGEYLVFMDSDAVVIERNTFSRMVESFRTRPRLGALSIPIFLDEEGQIPWIWGVYFFDDYYTDWDRTHTETQNPESLTTCFVMVRKHLAVQIGGFDPVYFYQHEDLDFFLRFDRTGFEKDLLPDLRIWHRNSFSGRKQDRWFWMHFREEWKHQYLVIKNTGVLRAARFMVRNMFNPLTVRAYYVRPIRKRKFIALWVILPFLMLLISPWIVLQRYRNPLRRLQKRTGSRT